MTGDSGDKRAASSGRTPTGSAAPVRKRRMATSRSARALSGSRSPKSDAAARNTDEAESKLGGESSENTTEQALANGESNDTSTNDQLEKSAEGKQKGKHKPRTDKDLEKSEGMLSRKTALDVVMRIEKEGAFSNIALANALKSSPMSKRDKAFVTCLVQGIIRNDSLLDERIKQFSKEPLEKLPLILKNTLRMGIFQLEFLKEIPPHAVLNTSTSLARTCGHKGLAKFTTAILRSYQREYLDGKDNASNPGAEASEVRVISTDPDVLSKEYSVPPWIIVRWQDHYSESTANAFLEFFRGKPKTVLRVNEQSMTPEGLITILGNNGIDCHQSPLVPACLIVDAQGKSRGGVEKFPGYAEGLFTTQDEPSALVSLIVNPQPGETILDLCAAPGGKALHMGELMQNKGRVIAVDKHEKRFKLLRVNRTRLELQNIETVVADGVTYDPAVRVHRALVDAPCSGTGVLNRRPDIKLRRQEEDIQSLANLQFDLLQNAANRLMPGGTLVYATCSLEPEENDGVVDRFVSQNPNFQPSALTPFLPEEFVERHALSDSAEKGRLQLQPTMDGVSGFFIARFFKADTQQ